MPTLLKDKTAQTRLHHSSIEGLRKSLSSFPFMLEKLMSAGKSSRKMSLGLGEVLEKDNLQHFHFSLFFFISLRAQAPHLQFWVGLDTDSPQCFQKPHPQGQSRLLCLRDWHCVQQDSAAEPVSFTRDGGTFLTAAIKASAAIRGLSLAMDTPKA